MVRVGRMKRRARPKPTKRRTWRAEELREARREASEKSEALSRARGTLSECAVILAHLGGSYHGACGAPCAFHQVPAMLKRIEEG